MRGLFSERMSPDTAAALASIMSESRPVATRAMARALAEADLREELPSINVPTLLIHGEADERSTLAVAEDLHERISTSSLVVLPELGHECSLEDPGLFNSEVRRFLAGQT